MREFLLELVNNNYSQETVENYERDLNFFRSFLWSDTDIKGEFTKLDKLAVSRYKGFLKQGQHLDTWLELRKLISLKEVESFAPSQSEKNGGDGNGTEEDSAGKKDLDADLPINTGDRAKSSHKASKIDYSNKGGLSARSINRMLSSLRGYFKFLIDIDQDVPIPPDAIKLLKTEKKESQVAEFPELVSLIESPTEFESAPIIKLRNRAMLELLFSTGMRISELVNLNREQLQIYSQTGDDGIAGKMYVKGKGKKSRFIYLTERCKLWLDGYLQTRSDDYPAMFIPYRGGRAGTKDPAAVRISVNYIQDRIITYRRKLGIIVPTSAHSLRHGFATYLAEGGASPTAIQRLLGHESLQTTTRYVHTSDKVAEKAHRQFHPLQESSDQLPGSIESQGAQDGKLPNNQLGGQMEPTN